MGRRIEGLITSTGLAGARTGGMRTLVLFLQPWREAGGELRKRALRVEVLMESESSAKHALTEWMGYGVALSLSMLHYPSAKKRWGLARAEPPLRRIDPETLLDSGETAPACPATIDDPELGELCFDSELGWYEGQGVIGREPFELIIVVPEPDDRKSATRAIRRARGIVTKAGVDLPRIKEAVAKELLDSYNDQWRPRGRPLSRAGFVKRLGLTSIHIDPGRTTMWLDPSGLFGEHAIEVRRGPRGKILEILVA